MPLLPFLLFSSLFCSPLPPLPHPNTPHYRGDTQAVVTVPCGSATSLVVVPGDRHALVGTRSGHLQLIDFASATILEDILAHEPDETAIDTGVWTVTLTHDGVRQGKGNGQGEKAWWCEELRNTDGLGKRE